MEETESVWNIIVEHVPESELSEIRVLLGDALIDIYTEMYSEVTMWQQIWQTLRLKQGNRPKAPRCPLADPPAIKELLKAEIQLLLATVRERAAQEGRSCSQSSVTSTTNQDEIDAMRHMLNITHIDDIVAHLKSVLSEECNVLKSKVQFLQESVEQEHQTQHDVTEAPEPTVTELKEERRAIQMDMKRQSLSLTHCSSSSPVETSLQIRSRSTGWTGFPADETQRHLIPVVATRPHPPHTKPPLVTSLVRSTPPLDRMRGQPRSSPNTREPSPLQPSKCEQLRTYSQSSEASHTCNRGPTTTQDRDSYLPPLVLSASTVTSLEPYLNPPSEERVKGRTCRRSGQTVTEGAQRHDDSWSDSVNSWPSLSSGGHCPLGSSTQPPGSKGSCEQMSPVRMFHPAPPAMQRPASRGQSVARHMCLPQRDSLVSSL
ncbi:coiled-coil domain-containing protein 24 isoform X2 [Oncorhynchus tshawytscha]|uniref:coiled-coil domain-containing protein 24 isoform X2 n=1 Tax=Oncorhynchus tshawytscha TaxID=74940 RepID=UPI000D099579|nr:coiled-coil domain-containing protein 24 isoform X2 [Oncorhynchus tshawytscha]